MKTNFYLRMLVAVIILLPLSGLKAQFNFIKNYGTLLDENGTTTQTCANGDFITAGTHSNGIDLDMYVVRTTNAGVLIWAQWYPMLGTNEQLFSIKENANGDFVMAGYITTGMLGAGPRDVLVHRINAAGGVLWTHRYGDVLNDEGKDIIEIPGALPGTMDLVVVGYSESTAGNRDYYALRTNAAGILIWQTRYPGPGVPSGDEVANSVLLNAVTGNLSILGWSNFYTSFPGSFAATLLNVLPATGGAVGLFSYDIPFPQPVFNEYGYKLIQLFGPLPGPGQLMMLCHTNYGPNPNNIWVIRTTAAGAPLMSRVYDFLSNDDQASMVENPVPAPLTGMTSVSFSHVRRFGGAADLICMTNISPATGAVNWAHQFDQIVYTPDDLTHSLDFVPGDGGYVQVARSNINTSGGTDFHLIKTTAAGQSYGHVPDGDSCYSDLTVKIDSPIINRQWTIAYKSVQPNVILSTINIPFGLQTILCFSPNRPEGGEGRKPASEEESAPAYTTVYPNPSNGAIILQFNAAEATGVTIRIYNTTGQLLLSKSVQVEKGVLEQMLDLSKYPSGLYLLQVQKGGKTEYHKVMIEK